MEENIFKRRMGLGMVIIHMILVLIIIGLFLLGGFHRNEFTTLFLLILPPIAIYIPPIIHYFINSDSFKNKKTSKTISSSLIITTILIAFVYFSLIISSLFFKAFNVGNVDFEIVKVLHGVGEACIGVYLRKIFFTIYQYV